MKNNENELNKKDFVIRMQQQVIREYQIQLARAGVQLPTDASTRKKAIEDFIHNENLAKEKAKQVG